MRNDGLSPEQMEAIAHELRSSDTILDITSQIAVERARQIAEEGHTRAGDDELPSGTLAQLASVYALHAAMFQWSDRFDYAVLQIVGPSIIERMKPKFPRRDLIRAAALIVAEIERLDRAEQKESGNGQ